MSIKNRPFNPDLLIKVTLPEESGDTVSYEYRHCDIEETIESEDGCLQHVVTITPLGFMASSLSASLFPTGRLPERLSTIPRN